MHRLELLQRLDAYQARFIDESANLDRARTFVLEHADCFDCDLWPGHVTGSAWVVNRRRDRVLLLHHRKHDRWFQPGGHADGQADILQVALRETAEETGLDPAHIRLVGDRIFDVDVHRVAPSPRDPAHTHYDIRFLVEIDDDGSPPGNAESFDLRWVPLDQVKRYNNSRSTHRMVEKTRRLR